MTILNKIRIGAFMFCAVIFVTTFTVTSAMAEVAGIGTTKGGANAVIGATIAEVVSDQAGFQLRPQKMGGTQQYIPVINDGKLEFGLSNIMQFGMAVDGTGLSEGTPYKNLRLVATLMEFQQGVIVPRNSGIKSLADLKGKRVPTGYVSSPLFELFKNAFLASAGLSEADVTPVPVVNLPKSWAAFREGKVDMTICAAGAGPIKEMEAAIDGGVEFIPLIDNEIARKALPRTHFKVVEPGPKNIALRRPTLLHVYEYVVFANASVSDDMVYKVVKAIVENEATLRAGGPFWRTYYPENIAKQYEGLEYHPGAVKFFKEKGLMK